MNARSMKVAASALAIALGVSGVGVIEFPEGAIAQQQTSELDRAITEGSRLFKEGSAESLRRAIGQFEKALELARSSQTKDKQALLLLALGKLYDDLGEKQKALQFYNQSLPLWRDLGDQMGEARTLNNIGLAYDALGEKQKALEFYNQALPLWRDLDDRTGEARTLNNIGLAYDALGEKQKALEFYNQALPLSRAVGDRSGEATTLNNIGGVYNDLGEKQKVLEFYNQALPLSRAVGDRSGEATTLNNIGAVYDALGEKQKALGYYNQALPLRRAVGDRNGEATTLNNIGRVYSALGEKQKALEYYNQALLLRRAVGDRSGEATTLNNIGAVYDALGEKQKALDYYNQALPLRRAVGDHSGEAGTLHNIGSVYNDLDEKQKALEYYNSALLIVRAVGDSDGEAGTLNNIGLVYSSLGEKQKALEFFNQALPFSRAVGDRSGEATILNNIGSIYHELGEKRKALDYYNRALPILRTVGNRSMEATTLNNIGALLNNQPNVAIVFYKQSVNIYESLRKDIRKLPRETQEIYTSSVAGTYRRLADTLLTQGRIREAQSILELLKVQELQGYGKDQEANASPIQFPFHSLESQTLQTIEKAIASKSLSLEALKPIGQPLIQNRDRITQDMNNTPIAIGNPQALLKANPNAILIQNLVANDKLWVLWTNPSGKTTAIAVPNITEKQLTSTVQTFRQQLSSPTSDLTQLQATSQQLYNWLIPPQLQAELKADPSKGPKQLIVSLDHVTRYIPVAALYDGSQPNGQRYLAQRYTLSNLITTDTDMGDRLSPEGKSPTILALGTSNAIPGFNPLPNVEAELNAIVKDTNPQGIYPGKIRLNQAFTAKSLTENLDQFRVLHIATHGSFNPKSITASFLLLGNGDRLPITDIASLTSLTNTHLVVLSACETGISGNAQDGTEISGISGYFLRRGAKSVLASLWSVNDASTSLLMQQFYRHTAAGMTKAQALQTAQQDFLSGKLTAKDAPQRANLIAVPVSGNRPLNSSTTFAHPYYWAPFFLTGNSL